jgi:hypothetical protein
MALCSQLIELEGGKNVSTGVWLCMCGSIHYGIKKTKRHQPIKQALVGNVLY